MAEPVVILEPGDERAQKIAKAMASQTAGDILRLVGSGEKTATEIAEQLKLPMNTVQYHTENLLDAGLLSVASTKYSVKGREVKVYALTSQLLIVAPRQANLRMLLMKYASLFGIVAFGSLVIAMLRPVLMHAGAGPATGFSVAYDSGAYGAGNAVATSAAQGITENVTAAPVIMKTAMNDSAERALATTVSPIPTGFPPTPASPEMAAPVFSGFQDPAVLFFLGGACVILILLCYEWYSRRKAGNS